MTFQQLKYAIKVSECASLNEAAKVLFISQPSLSSSIKELEDELEFKLFVRTSRGVTVTEEGKEFLGYAKQVMQQTALLEEKYLNKKKAKQKFSVSTQHYLFAANAFVQLVQEFGSDQYDFTYRETRTYDVIDDVKNLRSQLGLIYLSHFNEAVIGKLLKESEVDFEELFCVKPHVFLSKTHPLAKEKNVTIEALDDYPCLSFEQGDYNSFYFSEEVLSTRAVKKSIKMSGRAAMVNFIIGLNGYTISSGVFPQYLHGEDIISVPLISDEIMRVGIITRKGTSLTRLGKTYVDALKKIAVAVQEDNPQNS